jgi:hypothetical protein
LIQGFNLKKIIIKFIKIFLGKINHGYVDKTELSISLNNPLGENVDHEEVKRKYFEEQELLQLIDDGGKDLSLTFF